MKFLKYILIITLFVSMSKTSSAATITGYGCRVGDVVYADKMGTTSFYGNNFDVYNSNGTRYNIDYNPGQQCDWIEEYTLVNAGSQCWVNSYVNSNNNQSGVVWGNTYRYTVNTCTPMNLPLDDYTWAILLVVGGIGAFYISKKGLLAA